MYRIINPPACHLPAFDWLQGMPKSVKDAKIACLDMNLQKARMHFGVQVRQPARQPGSQAGQPGCRSRHLPAVCVMVAATATLPPAVCCLLACLVPISPQPHPGHPSAHPFTHPHTSPRPCCPQVLVTDPTELERIRQRELDITRERIQKIIDAGAVA